MILAKWHNKYLPHEISSCESVSSPIEFDMNSNDDFNPFF